MKKWIKKILCVFCCHPESERQITEYAKAKYVRLRKGSASRLRYDLWSEERCCRCGKRLNKGLIRRNLTHQEVEKYFGYGEKTFEKRHRNFRRKVES